jgi:hypothetical protein
VEIADPEAPLAEARWSWRRPVGADDADSRDRIEPVRPVPAPRERPR